MVDENPVISVQGLSKRFRVQPRLGMGRPRGDEDDVDDDLVDGDDADDFGAEVVPDTPVPDEADGPRDIWALRDVTFTVARGIRYGVLGRTGSGKTTLLRVLTRTSPPTEGSVRVEGRLLSAHAGATMLPRADATGRMNLLYMADLLHVPRDLVMERTDEIFAFAGLTEVIDREVRRYASGFGPRLVMSALLHFDADILVGDGGLVAGSDPEFRIACDERIAQLRAGGLTTIVAVSDPRTLTRVCDRAMWLDEGRIRGEGDAGELTERFLDAIPSGDEPAKTAGQAVAVEARAAKAERAQARLKRAETTRPKAASTSRPPRKHRRRAYRGHEDGSELVTIEHTRVTDAAGAPVDAIRAGSDAHIEVDITISGTPIDVVCAIALTHHKHVHLRLQPPTPARLDADGRYRVTTALPSAQLEPAAYQGRIQVDATTKTAHASVASKRAFAVFIEAPDDTLTPPEQNTGAEPEWTIEPIPS